MIMLIPIATILTLATIGLLLIVWIPCIQIAPLLATILCVFSVFVIGAAMFVGIKFSKKAGKPIYLGVAVILFLLASVAALFRTQIIDYYNSVIAMIGPGSLPPNMLN